MPAARLPCFLILNTCSPSDDTYGGSPLTPDEPRLPSLRMTTFPQLGARLL
jgi:hypothetical protein